MSSTPSSIGMLKTWAYATHISSAQRKATIIKFNISRVTAPYNLNDQTMQTLAQKVLATGVGATLVPMAKDVDIQVEFNPESAAEEKPAPLAKSDEIDFPKLRYRLPNEDKSRLMKAPINKTNQLGYIAAAGDDARFAIAVTAFAQKLRGHTKGGNMSSAQIRAMAAASRGEDTEGYHVEFLSLVDIAKSLDPE